MAELSAYILAYNEEENVGPLMDSLKGVHDVVVLDNGSTDRTVELFRERGAHVEDGTTVGKYTATEEDVASFRERYGFGPGFVAGEVFDHAGERRNYAASLCKNDWVVNPDCDERPEWDLRKVRGMMNGQGGLRHRYIFKHAPDGTPLIEFILCKLYNREVGHFVGRIHEVLVDQTTRLPVASEFCPDFVLHHWRKDRPHRATHLKQLEFQAQREDTARNLYYLGREYADKNEHEKSLAVYQRYLDLPGGDFFAQRCQAYLCMAACYRHLGRFDEAVDAYHRAMIEDDTRRDAFFHLGMLYMERNEFRKAIIWFSAADTIPLNPQGYLNDIRLYTWAVHDQLSVCYHRLGQQDVAFAHWLEALKHLPEDEQGARILGNGRWMVKRAESGDSESTRRRGDGKATR